MSYSSIILAEFPSLYWKLNETSGTTAADATGNGRTGTYTNSPTQVSTSLLYDTDSLHATNFDGTNDYITKTLETNYTGSFSLEAWIKPESFTSYPGVMGAWTANSSGNYGSAISIDTSGYIDVYLAKSTWNAWEFTSNTGIQLTINQIYHIVLTVNNASGSRIAKLYLNGSQVWSQTFTNSVGLGQSGRAFRVGMAGSISSGATFDGSIQNVAVYNESGSYALLTSTQVSTHYNAGLLTQINAACPNIGIGGNKKPSVALIAETAGTPNKLHASGDFIDDYDRIASEGWTYTSNGGTPHYTDVDESVVDYSDYITNSGTISDGQYWYYSLYIDTVTDPQTDEGHILRYAYKATWDDYPLAAGVWLYSGSTFIGSYSNDGYGLIGDNNGDPIIFQVELPAADVALIDNYNDLFFVPYIIGYDTDQNIDFKWYWFELEVPQLQVTGGIANLTNININGKNATISTTSNIQINAISTHVDIIGSTSTIDIQSSSLQTANITNTNINGQNVTINTISNVQVENSPNTINITGHNVSLSTGISSILVPETGLITLDALDATISIINPIIINATTSNIALNAKNTSSAYYNTVSAHTPIHWWRMNDYGNWSYNINYQADINDSGSNPINGTSNIPDKNSFQGGIPGAWTNIGYEALLTNVYSNTTIKFASNPISNNNNITLEFWIKPSSGDTLNNNWLFVNNTFNYGTTSEAYTGIGFYNYKLSIVRKYKISGVWYTDINSVGNNITTNTWHHIVLTKSTTGGTSTYKSYVDGQETATPASIGDWFYYDGHINYQSLTGSVNSSNTPNSELGFGQTFIDEIAVYNTTLSYSQIVEHYTNGLLGPLNATISADRTNIYLQGIQIGTQVSVSAPVSNIAISGRNPTLNILGSPTIITNAPNINVNGQNAIISNGASRTISVQKTSINININTPKIKTRDAEFIFIDKNDVSLSANDAIEINGIDFGGLLYNQIKKDLFKIGNISDFISSFNISVYSKETQVISAIKLSTDNINYSDTIYIENIGPNQISDNIYVKFDINALDVLGPGTFLVKVEQIYVV